MRVDNRAGGNPMVKRKDVDDPQLSLCAVFYVLIPTLKLLKKSAKLPPLPKSNLTHPQLQLPLVRQRTIDVININ